MNSCLSLFPFSISAVANISPSGLWALPLIAAILLLLNVADGWRQGLVRKLWTLFSVLLAGIISWFAGHYLLPVIAKFVHYPDTIMNILAYAVMFLGCFILLCFIGSLKIAPTEDYESAPTRFIIGSGGACIGFFTGILWLILFALFLRHSGNVAKAAFPHELHAMQQRESVPNRGLLHKSKLWGLSKIIWAAESLEHYPALIALLNTIDPVPEQTSRVWIKSIRVLRDPESTNRLMHHPEILALQRHPRLQSLMENDEISQLAQQRDIHNLLRHPAVIELLNDVDFQRELAQRNLEKALDDSL